MYKFHDAGYIPDRPLGAFPARGTIGIIIPESGKIMCDISLMPARAGMTGKKRSFIQDRKQE
jgi:hypothetical protein